MNGIYTEYINKKMDFQSITLERKKQLRTISELRSGRDIFVYASDLTKRAPINVDYTDILAFYDQISILNGNSIDIILETPGGLAEVVEDLVKIVREKYEKVGIIIPGYAKSAGTIFAMAGDEILMGPTSSLGPIDAQIVTSNGKRFSADAFLQGLNKIKIEVEQANKLNPAYIPILQSISPGEIQHCENAQDFSMRLVSDWLSKYKFKFWDKHSSNNKHVTEEEKISRAEEIAKKLCDHSHWLTHARSIKIKDLEEMKLKVTDYSKNKELNDAIMRYYTLLRMSFDANIYKIFETCESQIYRLLGIQINQPVSKKDANIAFIKFKCPKCQSQFDLQANLGKQNPLREKYIQFPLNDIFKCPVCAAESNLSQLRLQLEAQSGKKLIC